MTENSTEVKNSQLVARYKEFRKVIFELQKDAVGKIQKPHLIEVTP